MVVCESHWGLRMPLVISVHIARYVCCVYLDMFTVRTMQLMGAAGYGSSGPHSPQSLAILQPGAVLIRVRMEFPARRPL
jgi:hypothetical protein